MTNKYLYFVANWKMFGDLKALKSLDKVIKFSRTIKQKKIKLIYCPPSTLNNSLSNKLKKTKIEVGAQNSHESEKYGAFTGQINSKIKSALKSGLKIIFCIGETLKEKRNKKTNQVLSKQIKMGLKSIRKKSNIIIAYEPVWSIGTGLIPKQNDLIKSISFIKKKLGKKPSKILYGGSVKSDSINQLKNINTLDGFLIGGASQHPKKFIDIIKKTIN